MSAIVELPSQAEIEQASRIDWKNLKAQWILFDSFQAEFISCWNLIVLVQCFCFDAQDIDIFLCNQSLKQVLFLYFLISNKGSVGL